MRNYLTLYDAGTHPVTNKMVLGYQYSPGLGFHLHDFDEEFYLRMVQFNLEEFI